MREERTDEYDSTGTIDFGEGKECLCGDGESCGICHNQTKTYSVIDCEECDDDGAKRLEDLLIATTISNYIHSANEAYGQDKDLKFELKSSGKDDIPSDILDDAASLFFEMIEQLISESGVRIHELDHFFSAEQATVMLEEFAKEARNQFDVRTEKSLKIIRSIIEKKIKKNKVKDLFISAIKDTAYYPIAVLWYDDVAMTKDQYITKSGKADVKYNIGENITRIEPYNFWFTPDWDIDNQGEYCFVKRRFNQEQIIDLYNRMDNPKLKKNISSMLNLVGDHHNIIGTFLFNDKIFYREDGYDILICRGKFDKADLKEAGVDVGNKVKGDFALCDAWYSGDRVINIIVHEPYYQDLGVYVTTFRENKAITQWGMSLYDFVKPFAAMYAGSLSKFDFSIIKQNVSIVSIDVGMIDNPDQFFQKDEMTGEYVLDLSEDVMIPFDSSKAQILNPNSKGKPIFVDKLDNNLVDLTNAINFILDMLEYITNIPRVMQTGVPESSAIRTDEMYNAAYHNATKPVRGILRNSENKLVSGIIKRFFDKIVIAGTDKFDIYELQPYILTTEQLPSVSAERNKMIDNLMLMLNTGEMLPPEKVSMLINRLGKELGIEEKLIPNVGALGMSEEKVSEGQGLTV